MTVRQTIGFFALCLLASTAWLTVDLLPSLVAPIAGQAFCLLLVGLAGLLLYLAGRNPGGLPSASRCGLVSIASLGLIGIPFLLMTVAQGKLPSSCGVLIFACMPIVVTVIGASSSSESGLRDLPYGLLGIAGIMILLPISLPQGSAGIFGVGTVSLAMVSTALCLPWLHRLLTGFPLFLAISLAGLVNGGLLVLAARVLEGLQWDLHVLGVESLRGLLLVLPELILLIWLIKAVTPQHLSTRYLATPLLTVIEGWFVLRPGLDVRTAFGITLLSAGVWLLIRSKEATRQPTWRSFD